MLKTSRPLKTNQVVFSGPSHKCGPQCIAQFPFVENNFQSIKINFCSTFPISNCSLPFSLEVNPLAIPMMCGWSREKTKHHPRGRQIVVYKSPCGQRLKNIKELHRYLLTTGCELGVDLFCFQNFFCIHQIDFLIFFLIHAGSLL